MKALLLIVVALLSSAAVTGQSSRTAERIQDVPFSQLDPGGNLPNGSSRHVINGVPGTTPCTAGGTGAFAMKIAGVWQCGKLTPGVGTGDVLGTTASTPGEVVLFTGTGGKTIGRSNMLTGFLLMSSGVASAIGSTGTGSVVRDNTATLTAPVLITPTVSSFINAQHLHTDANNGGQLNASNVFSGGTIPPARVITGTITNSRCLRVSNVGQIEVAAADCGVGGGGTPGGVSGNLTFNEAGAFGGLSNTAYDTATGRLTITQKANSNDTVVLQRFTDSSPTGTLLRARNAANTTDLWSVNADGGIFTGSTVLVKTTAAPATPASGNTIVWADSTGKNLRAQDDAGNVSGTVRAIACSGTDKISAISSAGVPTCTADQGGTGTGVITLNGLNTSDQTFAAVSDTNVTLAINSVTSTHTFTVGWSGRLSMARQYINTVASDQANTWSTGAQSFAAATSLIIPSAAGASPTASGLIAYDTTSNTLEAGVNGTNRTVAFTASSQTFSDKTLDNTNTVGLRDTLFTLQDNTDATKTVNFELGSITSGQNRTVTIADAASVTVQPTTATTNQFVTHIDSAGVVQKAQPSFANLSGSMGATQGGTGQTAVAQGDLLFGDATNSWARLPKSTTAVQYLSNSGASNNPVWAKVDLVNGVTSILLANNGGTANGFFAVSGPATSTKTFTFPNASASVLTDAATVTIAQGGTGATTQTAAFNGLDPLTTKGDIVVHDGTNSIRLGVGTNGQGLVADSTVTAGVKWATFTAAAAGSTTQLQRNNAGALGGISGATSDGTDVTFGAGNVIIGSVSAAPTPSLGRLYVDSDDGKLYFGINGSTWGEVFVSGLSVVNLASANVTGVLPAANIATSVLDGSVGYCADAGSDDSYGCSLSPVPAAYVTGGRYRVKVNTANTGAATVNLNSLGAITIKKLHDQDVATGDIEANQILDLVYDGTFMQMQSQLAQAPAGSGTVTVVSSGSLTSTALVTGGGSQTLQTPSATSTLDSSGNMALPGSLTLSASGAGYAELAEGTAPSAVANRVTVAAPTDVTAGGWVLSLPTTAGTNGQFLQTNGSGVTTWASPAGSGTVTATGGSLTANSVVLGAGTTDTKVVAGIITDGTSKLTLGVAGTSVGSIDFKNATSGTITLSPVTGALGTVTLSLPARTATVATTTGTLTSGRCVEIDASGNLIQAAAACGSGGSGTINSGVTNIIPKYTAATTLDDSLLSDDATTLTYSGSGGFSLTATGGGYLQLTEGTPPSIVANTVQHAVVADAPAAGTQYLWGAAAGSGVLRVTNSSGVMTVTQDAGISHLASSTSADLRGVLSDESGTGAAIFAGGNIGAGTATTASANDNTTLIATTAYVQTELTAYASDTKTLTNTTVDTEATGNVFTSTHKFFLAAAGCSNTTAVSFWDLPASTPAVPACVTGTNTQKGVLDFADTSGGFSAQSTIALPGDFSGTIDARIYWITTATSGNAKWSLSTICTATDATETDDPAFNTASTATTAAPGVASRVQTSAITSVTITGCAANELMHVKVFRDGNDAADTISATARLVGVEFTVRRVQ